MGTTKIKWTATRLPDGSFVDGFTFNPVIGCHPVSPGCGHCFARDMAQNRMKLDVWDDKAEKPRKNLSEGYWKQPKRWNTWAERNQIRRKVFCGSMCDIFEDHPTVNRQRERLWPLIEQTPWLDWLLLTKRPENIMKMLPYMWRETMIPDNIWCGTSVENQRFVNERVSALLRVPARVRFLSCEPLLGPVDLRSWLVVEPDSPCYWAAFHPHVKGYQTLQWVITGGESGPKHRLFDPQWARDIHDLCDMAHVSYFHKQNGGLTSHSGGHLLDGQEYMAWPE